MRTGHLTVARRLAGMALRSQTASKSHRTLRNVEWLVSTRRRDGETGRKGENALVARVTRPVALLEAVLHLNAFLRQSRRRANEVRSDTGERLGSERASAVAVRSILLVLQEVFLGVLEELSDMRSFDHVSRLCAEKG
jgi:hypothetical protein